MGGLELSLNSDIEPVQTYIDVCTPEDRVSLCENDPPHKNGRILSHSDTALPLINSESFWQNYEIVKSRGDGHCFIYSAVSSLRYQHNMSLDAEAVLRYITHESLNNVHRYMYLFESVQTFELEMFNYINEKTYDSSYVDLLPHFLANALRLPIIVICQKDDAYDYNAIPYTDDNNQLVFGQNVLLLFKNGLHYDGLR